jgi:lysyl-tRNA synthetase, class II
MTQKKDNPENPATPGEAGLTDQEQARREKLAKLAERGIPLFPHKAEITHTVDEIVREFSQREPDVLDREKTRVAVPGRIMTVRKMGRATFFHISDSRSRLQAYLREDSAGKEAYDMFSLLDIGDLVCVEGPVFKTRTGELTVLCEKLVFLGKCLHPLPEKWHGLQDIEIRYRKRYLDILMNPEVGEIFRLRSALVSRIRKFFDDRGYMEVETPMMHVLAGGALARPFQTYHNALDLDLYLRVAPELYLKRLVVGGFDRVYEINRNFRNEGISSEHNPEFTMLEFYQAYSDYDDMMNLTEELLTDLALSVRGSDELPYGNGTVSLRRPFRRLSFMDALAAHSGLSPEKLRDRAAVIQTAAALTPDAAGLTYGKALDVIFDKRVKPGLVQPTFITHPPREISPLAKASRENPDTAERFELMIAGMEVANAFSELTDPAEQKRLFEEQAEARRRGDEESHRVDLDYIEALEYGLPPTGGEGIGIDRLVMLFSGKPSIREVILFPLLRPR